MKPDAHALAGPYALDAVTAEECAEFEAHLARCPSCRDEVDDLRAVAVRLADLAMAPPPAALRGRVLDLAERTPQRRPPVARPGGRGPAHGRLLAAAAVVVAVALGAGLLRHVAELRRRADRLEAVTDVLTAPDADVVPLEGEPTGADARLVHAPSARAAVLVARGLPDPPDGRVYELWLIEDGDPRPAGLFRPDDGRVEELVEGGLGGADAVAVTVEQEGGAPAPTGERVAQGAT